MKYKLVINANIRGINKVQNIFDMLLENIISVIFFSSSV